MSKEIFRKRARQKKNRQEDAIRTEMEGHYGRSGTFRYKKKGERAVVFGALQNRGGIYGNPALQISYKIRAATTKPFMSYVTVKDGTGNIKYYLDPLTRKKVTIEEMQIINARGIDPAKITEAR